MAGPKVDVAGTSGAGSWLRAIAVALILFRVLVPLASPDAGHAHHGAAGERHEAPPSHDQGCHFCRQLDPALPSPALVAVAAPVSIAEASPVAERAAPKTRDLLVHARPRGPPDFG